MIKSISLAFMDDCQLTGIDKSAKLSVWRDRTVKCCRMFLILSLFIFTLTNCKKDSGITCNLNAAAPSQGIDTEITYEANGSGDGAITSLTYASSSGNITVTNPTLPWTITALVPADIPISIVATGTVKNGSLKVAYSGNGGDLTGSDQCSQSSK